MHRSPAQTSAVSGARLVDLVTLKCGEIFWSSRNHWNKSPHGPNSRQKPMGFLSKITEAEDGIGVKLTDAAAKLAAEVSQAVDAQPCTLLRGVMWTGKVLTYR